VNLFKKCRVVVETFKKRVQDLEEEITFYVQENMLLPARILIGIFIKEIFGAYIPELTKNSEQIGNM
jgi:hypothetical protein